MVIVVLMAGAGSRFAREASRNPIYGLPKPMIPVLGRPILEWTTRSLPFIRHYNEDMPEAACYVLEHNLYFAIRTIDDEHYQFSDRLRETFGSSINIVLFDKMTRGNLETALVVCTRIADSEEILILDSDNAYDERDLLGAIRAIRMKPAALICYFRPIDDNPKWCFAIVDRQSTVRTLLEKDPSALQRGGQPMIGTFYFDSVATFKRAGEQVISSRQMTGAKDAKEFYMSQAVQFLIDQGATVYAHQVENVIQLGTPEDVENFVLSKAGRQDRP